MYEVIVLGATFAAAGIASRLKENCLVIERRGDGGYEFFGGQFFADTENLSVYSFLKECNAIFCADICSVQKGENGFICETHGVDGFVSYEAKRIIDTRATASMSSSKTYAMLIDSKKPPLFQDLICKKAKGENRYILELPLPINCDFSEARRKALELVENFSESQRLILLADEFSYTLKKGYPKEEDGILLLPSAAFKTPKLAFCAGEEASK